MIAGFVLTRETATVPVLLDLAQTPETFHAYAVPEDIMIREGDTVLVHGAPASIPYGEVLQIAASATVTRATWWERRWERFASYFALTELYEVGFAPLGEVS